MTMNWSLLTFPKGYKIKTNDLDRGYIKVTIEPLMRGYGNTVGNALRRVLLSSMEGSAIYGFTLDGIEHPLDTTDGIYEDATQIVLNMKSLNIATDENEIEVNINKKGPCIITGKDIEDSNSFVSVINKEQKILEATKDVDVNLTIYIKKGVGFEIAENMDNTQKPVNFIPVDPLYSPIIRVNYEIEEDIRVGTVRNFERLTMEIWHNRTQNPENFIPFAAKILKDTFATLIDFEEEEIPQQTKEEEDKTENKYLEESIDVLELSKRPYNCLVSSNITKIKQLVSMSREELMKMKNLGLKSLKEIEEKLREKDLYFGMNIKNNKRGEK